jgi:hypothetical protein
MAKAATTRRTTLARGPRVSRARVHDLLTFYYPMHYRIGMDLETLMGQGQVSRKQAAILWLIHARADGEGWIRRKRIESRLRTWFEISNPNITKLMRGLASPPLSLIEHIESPNSGREKIIRLTRAGERFVKGMMDEAIDYLTQQLSHIDNRELEAGVDFLTLAFERDVERPRSPRVVRPPQRKLKKRT